MTDPGADNRPSQNRVVVSGPTNGAGGGNRSTLETIKRMVRGLRRGRNGDKLRSAIGELIEQTERQAVEGETEEIKSDERQLIRNILNLHDLTVHDVMVPRADIVAVEQNITIAELLDIFRKAGHSRLPVYRNVLDDPVGIEFRQIGQLIKLGKTMDEALWEVSNRISMPEFKYFVISLSIQRETGGNLAETLENLSDILRKRQQMKLKVKAMSSEAKASAYIIGALPFLMVGILSLINYEYISTLFVDPRGITVAVAGLMWMGIGAIAIAKMISFEI